MTTQTEALKLAQKALSNRNAPAKMIYEALHAIKEARTQPEFAIGDIRALRHRIHELEGEVIGYKKILDAQPEQEPVAWISNGPARMIHWTADKPAYGDDWVPLYTTPQQRKPLTDEEADGVALDVMGFAVLEKEQAETALMLIRATEAAHGIKETEK